MSQTLSCKDLVKIYKKRTVVNKASIQVSKGEIVGLLGPNGAGKTTTFYMMVGMVTPDSGQVFIDDKEITKVPMYKRARMGIGYLPQEASVFRRLSVEDNIMAVLQMMKLTNEQRKEKLEKLIIDLNIAPIRKSLGFQLSGGERRRTEIARSLATDPNFILLDEPFAGVDPIAVEDIMNIVSNLKNRGIGVLLTDHNVHETLSIVDKAYILINGLIFKAGDAKDISEDEEVRKLYLGEKFKLDRY
ncbi:MAG: LPS export ABC transporter ATP-binding protein [Chlorobiaceae bacterium]|nr:LPS export ABC transporter ATP-binding protein [Chlorobiaceae bacterium]MBA4310029.1 LPS export ABC transporter ATP-binding protein [Chlorobiaceae bacterium]